MIHLRCICRPEALLGGSFFFSLFILLLTICKTLSRTCYNIYLEYTEQASSIKESVVSIFSSFFPMHVSPTSFLFVSWDECFAVGCQLVCQLLWLHFSFTTESVYNGVIICPEFKLREKSKNNNNNLKQKRKQTTSSVLLP